MSRKLLMSLSVFVASLSFIVISAGGSGPQLARAQTPCAIAAADSPAVGPSQAQDFCVVIEKRVDSSLLFEFEYSSPFTGFQEILLGDGDEIVVPYEGGAFFFNENIPEGWQVRITCESEASFESFSIDNDLGLLQFTLFTNNVNIPFVYCTFTNTEDEEDEESPTRTPTPTPTRTPTRTPTPTATPGPGNLAGPIGSFFNAAGAARDARETGNDPTPRPTTAVPTAAAQTQAVRPPSTGDGGLQ